MADLETIPQAVVAQDSKGDLRMLFFPDPAPLPDWANQDNDRFSRIFFVRIYDSNPKAFNIHVKRITLPVPIKQSQLTMVEVRLADAANAEFISAGLDLNLKLDSREDSLVIFDMQDQAAEFLAVRTNAGIAQGVIQPGPHPDLVHQARWVPGAGQKAVSVIMKGSTPRGTTLEQEYGLGVKMTNSGGTSTDINIDPKIKNDGED